jgi:hypothetical protein
MKLATAASAGRNTLLQRLQIHLLPAQAAVLAVPSVVRPHACARTMPRYSSSSRYISPER